MSQRSALRPDETIQKSFISTTSRLYGEFESKHLVVMHAWSFGGPVDRGFAEGAASRNVFVMSFRTEPYERGIGAAIPNYAHFSRVVAASLSVLFGKRFDDHGMLQNSGMHHAPDFSQVETLCAHWLPHNSHRPRVDMDVPLNLAAIDRIEALLDGTELDSRFEKAFHAAASFYSQALQTAAHAPEVAFIHLITAGEVIANFQSPTGADLLDEEARMLLEKVAQLGADGGELARRLAGRFRSVKRKFVVTLLSLVDDSFFERSEAKETYERFAAGDFEKRLAAAYDLRSRYVHTGTNFGPYIDGLVPGGNAEIRWAHPVTGDKALDKALALAPTLVGLERLIRYCLLRLASQHGGYRAASEVAATTPSSSQSGPQGEVEIVEGPPPTE